MSAPEQDTGRLRAEAAEWLVRVHSDAAGEDDWLALEAWLAGSPAHRAAFEEAELLWGEIGEHAEDLRAALAAPPQVALVPPPASRARRPPGRARPAWMAIAAVLILAVAAGLWVWRGRAPPEQVFTTAKGQTRTLALADGSTVELNSDSRLAVRVSRTSRNLELTRGEALFEVAKDRAHPFRVAAGDQRITVLGTRFDVLRYRGEVSVTVSRGVVRVDGAGPGAGEGVRLTAGEQLTHREGSDSSVLSRPRLDEVLAWRRGYLVYRDQPLSQVAADLDRFVPVPISVQPAAAGLRFSGAIRLGDEDAVLRALEGFLPVEAFRTSGRIELRSRSAH